MMLRLKNSNPVISFTNLRRLIGILGMALPFVCILGGFVFAQLKIQPSISFYYYTNVRDIFVGILVGVSMFLISYRGYEYIDDLISNITGLTGLGIAIFPCFNATFEKIGFFQLETKVSNIVHTVSAGLFFFLLAVNSIFIFTLTDNKKKMSKNKIRRNIIYVVCGVIIIISMLFLVILHLKYSQERLDTKIYVFILETIMLEAFGISWLIKGETILKD